MVFFFTFYSKDAPDQAVTCITDDHPVLGKWEKKEIEPGLYDDEVSGYPYISFQQGLFTVFPHINVTLKTGPPMCSFLPSIIYPPTKVKLGDNEYSAPGEPDKYLATMYGSDWQHIREPVDASKICSS